jgi:hypothetical protein
MPRAWKHLRLVAAEVDAFIAGICVIFATL